MVSVCWCTRFRSTTTHANTPSVANITAPSTAIACTADHQEGLLITTTSSGERSSIRNPVTCGLHSPILVRPVLICTEQTPVNWRSLPGFQGGISLEPFGNSAENRIPSEDN